MSGFEAEGEMWDAIASQDAVVEKPARRTRRERLEARAERRRQWAEARDRDGDAAREAHHAIADRIPFGQPILVGHHSERAARADQRRLENLRGRAVENWNMADRHEQAADSIESQLRTSIFSDDDDAIEKLREKLQRLEASRDRIKAFNASCRKGACDESLVTPRELESFVSSLRFSHGSREKGFPGYVLTNLGANIRRLKGRVEEIERTAAMQAAGDRGRGRVMESRYGGECADCGERFERGDVIHWFRVSREAVCRSCGEAS